MSLHDELKDMAHEEKMFAEIEETLDKTGKTLIKTGVMVVAAGFAMTMVFYGAIIFGIALAVRWVLS